MESKSILEMNYDELVNLYALKSEEIVNYEEDTGEYNYLKKQLELISQKIDEMIGEQTNPEELKNYIRVSIKAKELNISPRTIKNWIIAGKVNGYAIQGEGERRTWFVSNELGHKIEGTKYDRARDSKGRFIKNRGSAPRIK